MVERHPDGRLKLDENDPRVEVSDKTYIGFKAMNMGFDAHMTVLYLGQITKLQEQLALKFLEDYKHLKNTPVERVGFDMFGPNYDLPVLRVGVPLELWRFREALENHSYLPNPSSYDWNPHITLKTKDVGTITIHPTIRLAQLGLY